MIATLATHADAEGLRTCVVSTDRDAFQLCSENISLMMTPRGVADVQVYTPERVEARYGVRPDQVPDFIGLKGDTSDNIPGVPGIGDKTAGRADRPLRLARGGDRARRRALAGPLASRSPSTPTRRGSRRSSRRCGATSTSTSTRPSSCSRRPTARSSRRSSAGSSSAALLSRLDTLDEALPAAAPDRVDGRRRFAGARASSSVTNGRSGSRRDGDRVAVATDGRGDRRRTPAGRSARSASSSSHDAKSAGVDADDDTLLDGVPDRAGPLDLRALRPRARVRDRARARARRPTRRPRRSSWRPSCRGGSRRSCWRGSRSAA